MMMKILLAVALLNLAKTCTISYDNYEKNNTFKLSYRGPITKTGEAEEKTKKLICKKYINFSELDKKQYNIDFREFKCGNETLLKEGEVENMKFTNDPGKLTWGIDSKYCRGENLNENDVEVTCEIKKDSPYESILIYENKVEKLDVCPKKKPLMLL